MDGWKMNFLLGRPIFRGYVSFREGIFPYSLHNTKLFFLGGTIQKPIIRQTLWLVILYLHSERLAAVNGKGPPEAAQGIEMYEKQTPAMFTRK